MRLHVNPPLASWRCHPPRDLSRDVLWRIIDDNAKRFGFAGPTTTANSASLVPKHFWRNTSVTNPFVPNEPSSVERETFASGSSACGR
ncbi:MAG: hypothetical protein QF735_12000, partial [Phycisphaeraceae bacterium]|nr:hypothetical protein [Phycisphaeraceae bacterium]